MTLTSRRHRRKSQVKPRLEGLEIRLVLSTVIATIPAPGVALTASPDIFRVTFDSPIDPFSSGYNDVVVDRVASDGSLTPAYDNAIPPYENLDGTGTSITLQPSTVLGPGHYRLLLSGSSSLAGLDGSSFVNPDGSDETLGDFTIVRKGAGLNDAIDLGNVGSSTISVPGSLDFTANPNAVQLYKFTLTAGHNWRLGAEVSAQRDGSSLNSALALFDASGRPIATDDIGRPDAPYDPFLFHGLKPGVYFVGVSGTGDLPGMPGGYDPIAQSIGPAQSQVGGAYTLHLVADVADLPGALLGFATNHTDAADPTATGFTLRFSQPLDLGGSGADVFSRSTNAIEVVGQDGKSWPIAAVNYDAEHAALEFLFLDRLPEGVYTVQMNASHPLTDLAGLVPISPTLPKGELATFRVLPDLRVPQADGTFAISNAVLADMHVDNPKPQQTVDLGPLTPNLVMQGMSGTFTLQPGQTLAVRFVSLHDDFYKFLVTHTDGDLAIDLCGMDSTVRSVNAGPANQENGGFLELSVGQYIARFTVTGDQPMTFTSEIVIQSFGWDSFLANGLGQGPALNLRLISTDSPTSFSLSDSNATASGVFSPASVGSTGAFAGPLGAPPVYAQTGTNPTQTSSFIHASTANTELASRGPSGLSFEIGGVLVGRPSKEAEHVAAVGPGESGAFALAALGPAQALAATGTLRGAFSPSGELSFKVAEEAKPAVIDGAMPSQLIAETPLTAAASEPQKATAAIVGETEILEVSKSSELVTAENGAAIVSPVEVEETEASQSSAAWVLGLLGMTALSARWVLHKRHRAIQAAKPASRLEKAIRTIPAPHARPSLSFAKSHA